MTTVWIVAYVDFDDNLHSEVFEDWEVAWLFFTKMEQIYGDNNVTIKQFKEVKMNED